MAADPFEGAASDGLDELNAKLQEEIAAREEKERVLTEERKDQAEKDLDKYYDDLTDKKAMKQAQNREHEELTKAQTEKDVSNPFERVVDLIGGAADDGAACDKSIFRSLLVRLKNDPKPPARPAAAETEPAAPEPEPADDPFAAADP